MRSYSVIQNLWFPSKNTDLQITTIEFRLHGINEGSAPCLLVLKIHEIRQLKCRDTDKPYGRELSRVLKQHSFFCFTLCYTLQLKHSEPVVINCRHADLCNVFKVKFHCEKGGKK